MACKAIFVAAPDPFHEGVAVFARMLEVAHGVGYGRLAVTLQVRAKIGNLPAEKLFHGLQPEHFQGGGVAVDEALVAQNHHRIGIGLEQGLELEFFIVQHAGLRGHPARNCKRHAANQQRSDDAQHQDEVARGRIGRIGF